MMMWMDAASYSLVVVLVGQVVFYSLVVVLVGQVAFWSFSVVFAVVRVLLLHLVAVFDEPAAFVG